MPKTNHLEKAIPKLYRNTSLNLLMFGYVSGVRATLHTLTIKQALKMFMETFGLSHDEFNIHSAATTYNNLLADLKQNISSK